jgi:hypothetical protein
MYFGFYFQWFYKSSLRFRPGWLYGFLSSCGIRSSFWDVFIARIWNRVSVNSLQWAATPWVSTHTQ